MAPTQDEQDPQFLFAALEAQLASVQRTHDYKAQQLERVEHEHKQYRKLYSLVLFELERLRRQLLTATRARSNSRCCLGARHLARCMDMSFSVHDVFTPTKPARLTFVERQAINERLVNALRTPGKQLVVYGHSGSGKTTLLVNKLHQVYESHVTSRCVAGMTFDQLVADAFDQLGPFYTSERGRKTTSSSDVELSVDYLGIKSALHSGESSEVISTRKLVLPPQLTAQTLGRFMGAAHSCWVLEDFHKIASAEKHRLAQMMKVFMDMSDSFSDLRIVALGAVDTAREVVEYDAEMRNRVSEIHVPLMNTGELREMIAHGEKLLNVQIAEKAVDGIVTYSNGLASVCHQLCLNLCNSAGISETSNKLHTFEEAELQAAVREYLEEMSDTLKSVFDKALRIKKKGKFDNTRIILLALLEFSGDGATHGELLTRIQKRYPEYPAGNLNHFLRSLQSDERGRIVRYDAYSGRFSFSDPIYRAVAATRFGSTKDSTTTDNYQLKIEWRSTNKLRALNTFESDLFQRIFVLISGKQDNLLRLPNDQRVERGGRIYGGREEVYLGTLRDVIGDVVILTNPDGIDFTVLPGDELYTRLTTLTHPSF